MNSVGRRGRRALVITVRIVVGLVAVLGLAWLFRTSIVSWALERVAASNGIQVTWTSLEVKGVSGLEIGGLSARRVPDIDVKASRIEVGFDVWTLARGNLAGVKRVRVLGLEAEVGPFAAGGGSASGSGSIQLPRSLPLTDVSIVSAVVHLDEDRSVALTSGSLHLADNRVEVHATQLAWKDGVVDVAHPLDLRVLMEGGRFEVQSGAWDPRVQLDHASGDLSRAHAGRFDLEAQVHGFEGTGRIELKVDGGVLAAQARVKGLDVGAALHAFFATPWAGLAGRADLDVDVRVPLRRPIAFEGSVDLAARGVHLFGRDFDSIDGRVVARADDFAVERLVVVHGADAVSAQGLLPRPPYDGCSFLDHTTAWVEADVGDLGQLLAQDIEVSGVLPLPGDAPVGPLHLKAALGGTVVRGSIEGKGVHLGPILAMFGAATDAEARFDAHADVTVPLLDARAFVVDSRFTAVDLAYRGRQAELLAGRVHLGPDALVLQDTVIVQGANTVFIPLAHLPPLPIDPCTVLQYTTAQIRAELRDLPAIARASEPGSTIGELPPHRLAFRATLIGDTLNVEDGTFSTQGNKVTLQVGRVPLHDGPRAILFDDRLDLALDVDLEDASATSRILAGDLLGDLPLQGGVVTGHVRLRGDPKGPRGEIGLVAHDLIVRDTRFDEVNVSADLTQERIDVTALEARSSLGTLSGGGLYVFAEKRLNGAHLEADVSDLEQLAPTVLPSGALRVQARADGTLNALDGTLTVRANNLVWRDLDVEGFVLDARAEKGQIRIVRAAGRSGSLSARLAGSLEALDKAAGQWRIVLDELVLHLVDETSSLARRATIDVSRHDIAVRDLVLAGAAGSLTADVSWSQDMGCADVHAIGILPRFLLQRVQNWLPRDTQLDADVSAQWQPGSIEIVTSGSAQGTGIDPTSPSTATLAWKASLVDRRVEIEKLELRGDPIGLEGVRTANPATASVHASFPLDPFGARRYPDGPLEISAKIDADDVAVLPLPEAWSSLRGALHGALDLKGTWSDVRGSVGFDAEQVTASAWAPLEGMGPTSASLHLVLADDVHIEKAALHLVTSDGSTPADIEATGSIGAPLDARAWLEGASGSIQDAPLDASVKLEAVDLAPLALRVRALRRTGGRASATLRIAGTVSHPRLEGEASLEDGEIRTTTNLPSIAGVTGHVHFDGARLVIDELAGELGGAPFHMSGEMLVFDPEPKVDLSFEGQSVLLWRESDVTVRADAKLTLKGPIGALELSGDLALRDARYSRKFDFLTVSTRARATTGRRGFQLFSLQEPPFSNMKLDLHVTSATPFVVANNVVHAELSPDLRLQGRGDLPELRGTIVLEPSRVLLPSGTLRIPSGRIEFRLDDPDVPVLDIQATAHMQGYDVEINITGPYDNPRVDVSSVPPLPREDAVLLVLTGRPPSSGLTLATGERAAVDVAVYIARDVAAAWLSGEGEVGSEDSLAERIEVIVGAEQTKSGGDAVLVRMRLRGKPGERGAGLYVTGERDIYDFYNFGLRLVYTFR